MLLVLLELFGVVCCMPCGGRTCLKFDVCSLLSWQSQERRAESWEQSGAPEAESCVRTGPGVVAAAAGGAALILANLYAGREMFVSISLFCSASLNKLMNVSLCLGLASLLAELG